MLRLPVLIAFIFVNTFLYGQKIEVLTGGTKTSIRGLSVVNDDLVWVSGSNGTVGKSTDGGKTWKWITVPGFETRDFRDIEAFDANTAVIIAIAEPANILRTTDGGNTWKTVFNDTTKGMFLDALHFHNKNYGIVVGDPINDEVFLGITKDGGNSWQRFPDKPLKVAKGEAFFASSGTNIVYTKDGGFFLVSGGTASRLLTPDRSAPLDIVQGKESTGANSIAIMKKNLIVVGGDFLSNKDSTKNCVLSNDEGNTWYHPTIPPHGYRSCVEFISGKKLIVCGTSGVDVSEDAGMNWKLISSDGFHVVQKAKKGKAVFLAGGNGKIARLLW
jgi:photosystem II stability/assembly factor-like uncharacterized protein